MGECRLGFDSSYARPHTGLIFKQVLQELAAARKLYFLCGSAEMQGKMFRRGLIALNIEKHSQISVFHGRVRAVMALLDYSSAHKSLKGQTHLDIQPLAELVNMFHTHEATDRRDKIYALLGMCSDHDSAQSLAPDYSIEWGQLLEVLGRFMFGPHDIISASSGKELLYISSQCFALGWVSKVSMEGFWSDTQTLQVESFRPDCSFSDTNWWSVRCRLRKSGKEIRENDIVLLSEMTRKVVVARPTTFYLRIIAITDSRSIEIADENENDGWRLWHHYLKTIKDCPLTSRLVWNWNGSHETEAQDALGLMTLSSPFSSEPQAEKRARGNALYDMANLSLHCHHYDVALALLASAARGNSNVSFAEQEFIGKVQEQHIKAEQYASRYQKALRLIPTWQKRKLGRCKNRPDEAAWHCCALLLVLYQWHPSEFLGMDYPGPVSHWDTYAAKALIHIPELDTINLAAKSYHPEDLDILMSMKQSDRPLPFKTVLAVTQNQLFSTQNFFDVFRSATIQADELSQLIEVLSDVGHIEFNSTLIRCMNVLGDQIPVTAPAIEAALRCSRLSKSLLSVLLATAGDEFSISQKSLAIAAEFRRSAAVEIMTLLLDRAGPRCQLSEEVLVAVARNTAYSVAFLRLFLQKLDTTFYITEYVLDNTLRAGISNISLSVLPHLRYLGGIEVKDSFLRAAENFTSKKPSTVSAEMYKALLALKEDKPITSTEVQAIAASGKLRDIDWRSLIRGRHGGFQITAEVMIAAMRGSRYPSLVDPVESCKQSCDTWEPRLRVSHGYAEDARFIKCPTTSMITEMLYRTRDEDLEKLVQDTGVARYAAHYGCTVILQSLRSRDAISEGEFKVLELVARLKQAICSGSDTAETYHLMEELAQERNTLGVISECNFALMLAVETSADYAVNALLEKDLTDVNFEDTLGRTPLHIATKELCHQEITHSLLKHGAGASLDLEDHTGQTPRENINRYLRTWGAIRGDMTLWHFILKDIPNRESFGTISGSNMVLLRLD
jgi:hypothetical protein